MNLNYETAIALNMRANFIETGDVCMSKADVVATLEATERLGDSAVRRKFERMLIGASKLSASQVHVVATLREHAAALMNKPT